MLARQVYTCYEKPGETEAEILGFQEHEFTKHGACAGVDSADDYFTQARLLPRMNLMCSHLLRLTPSHGSLQACGLASGPLGLIRTARVGGMSLIEVAAQTDRPIRCPSLTTLTLTSTSQHDPTPSADPVGHALPAARPPRRRIPGVGGGQRARGGATVRLREAERRVGARPPTGL